jgi:hypothetical protein
VSWRPGSGWMVAAIGAGATSADWMAPMCSSAHRATPRLDASVMVEVSSGAPSASAMICRQAALVSMAAPVEHGRPA